jgi:DNA-binding Lrp family transcriptional regulator
VYLRPTYSSIAKKLGVDEETIRVNVKHAHGAGIIVGWFLDINPQILGQEVTVALLEVADASKKDSIIKQIRAIPGVIQMVDFYERPLRVDFCHETDQEREERIELLKSISGDRKPVYWRRAFPSVNMKLKTTDWHIVKALRRDSMLSNSEIAKEIGVSPRTVKRRVSLMTAEDVIYSRPVGDIKRFPGHVYFFLIHCMNEKKKRESDELIRSKLEKAVFVDTRSKQYSIFSSVFHNMGEADELYRWIKDLDGVDETRMYLEQQIIQVYDWLDGRINSHLTVTA